MNNESLPIFKTSEQLVKMCVHIIARTNFIYRQFFHLKIKFNYNQYRIFIAFSRGALSPASIKLVFEKYFLDISTIIWNSVILHGKRQGRVVKVDRLTDKIYVFIVIM